MSYVSLLAKDWALEVDTSSTGTPTWTPIRGLTKIEMTTDSESQDDSDFDSDGWGSDVVTQRKWKLDCEGFRKRDAAASSFTPDPGQEKIRSTGDIVGFGAIVHVRWYRKDGSPDAYTGYASVDYKGGGGGVTDLEPFSFTLLGQGKRTPIANPSED